MTDFSGRKILITGASKGLGLICAKEFASRGASLALLARSGDKLEALIQGFRNPSSHCHISVDLSQPSLIHSAVQTALEFLGKIDTVLHVAGGGLGLKEPLLNSTDLLKLLSLNLVAAVEINRLVVPGMQKRGSGNLVHVGSIASIEAVGSVGYNTAKAALAAYVRSIGHELAGTGVIATGILPGGFRAPENAMERLAKSNPAAYQKFIDDRLPRKVMGEANELLPLIFLLSSAGASMMSGCMVPVDAGEGKSYSS